MGKERKFLVEITYRNSKRSTTIGGIGKDLVNLIDRQMKDKKEQFVHFEIIGKKGPEDIKHKTIAYKEDISGVFIEAEKVTK